MSEAATTGGERGGGAPPNPFGSARTAPGGDPDTADARRGDAPERDDDSDADSRHMPEDEVSYSRECLKFLFIAGFIAALFFLADEVGHLLLSTRDALRRVPLAIGIPAFCVLTGPRRVILPVFYIIPFSTIFLLYLAAKIGAWRAGCIYQSILLLDSLWFLGIRRYWSDFMAAIVDPTNRRSRRCVPRDLLRALRGLDAEWAHRVRVDWDDDDDDDGRPASSRMAWSVGAVALLSTAWATDEQITLYFLSTRCGLSWPHFTLAWSTGLVLRLPETVVRALAIEIIAKNFASLTAIVRGLAQTPLWLLVIWALIAGSATITVHAIHAKLLVEWAGEDDDETDWKDDDEDSDDDDEETGRRRGRSTGDDDGAGPSSTTTTANGGPTTAPRGGDADDDATGTRDARRAQLRAQTRFTLGDAERGTSDEGLSSEAAAAWRSPKENGAPVGFLEHKHVCVESIP